MKGLAFAYDPDGVSVTTLLSRPNGLETICDFLSNLSLCFVQYSVEIIKRGGIDFGDTKKE